VKPLQFKVSTAGDWFGLPKNGYRQQQ